MAYDDRDDEIDDELDIRKPRHRGDVPSYLVQAILVTLCCCLPFGIVAIVHAAKVNGFLASGNYEQAVRASDEAKKWCAIALVLGLVAHSLHLLVRLGQH
jgi:Interferon-induced transmembrane protein